jgi:hypothetical protein
MLRHLKKRWKKIAVAVCVLAVLLISALIVTRDHWWVEVFNAKLAYDGKPANQSRIYRSRDGSLLISLGDEEEGALYLIYPRDATVGSASPSGFLLLPWCAYGIHLPPPFVLMQSAKAETKPGLIIGEGLVEFTSSENHRVQVTL